MIGKGEATQKRDDYLKHVEELAVALPKWAKDGGCFRDDATKEVEHYFVVERGKRTPKDKAVWCEWTGESVAVWKDVVDVLYKNGVDLCAMAFRGHYIGLPGERGLKFGSGINQAITRFLTASRMIEYAVLIGDWAEVEPFVDRRIQGGIETRKLLRLLRTIRRLANGFGRSTTISLAEFMLEATVEDDEDESGSDAAD